MRPIRRPLLLAAMLLGAGPAPAQVPPTPAEVAAYRDLHAAAARDDADAIRRLAAAGAYLNAPDGNRRTPPPPRPPPHPPGRQGAHAAPRRRLPGSPHRRPDAPRRGRRSRPPRQPA